METFHMGTVVSYGTNNYLTGDSSSVLKKYDIYMFVIALHSEKVQPTREERLSLTLNVKMQNLNTCKCSCDNNHLLIPNISHKMSP